MARPLAPVKGSQVYKLARVGCTTAEIATICETSEDTIERRFAGVLRKGREKMKMSLRRMQYKAASEGNVTMQIWLGKQYLKQRDEKFIRFDPSQLTDDQLERIAKGEPPEVVLHAAQPASSQIQ